VVLVIVTLVDENEGLLRVAFVRVFKE